MAADLVQKGGYFFLSCFQTTYIQMTVSIIIITSKSVRVIVNGASPFHSGYGQKPPTAACLNYRVVLMNVNQHLVAFQCAPKVS